MSDDDYRLEKRINKIREDEELDQETTQFLTEKYLNEVQRSGADKKNTQEIYLRRLGKILKQEKLTIQNIHEAKQDEQKLQELNDEIVDNVQNSKYKAGTGQYSVRTKRGFYGSWKRMLQSLGLSTAEYKDYMPNNVKFSSDRAKVDSKKKTTAKDLPTPQQVKQFVKTFGDLSSDSNKLRNQALIGLLWDAGPRIGEVIEDDELHTIKMKQVHVQGDRLFIKIKGNKNKTKTEEENSDRKVEIFQFRKLLKDYIQNHSKRNDPEAFLFPPNDNNQHNTGEERFYTATSKTPLREKIHRARRTAGLDFKTQNEPFHIFRKGMITYYVMNEILGWEKVCERTGKDPSSTMPIYLKMAMDDINAQAAEGFGLDTDGREQEHRMIATPLLPRECKNCGKTNYAHLDICNECGNELPESEMPKSEITENSENMVDIDLSAKIGAKAAMNPDKSINEIKEEVLQEHGGE